MTQTNADFRSDTVTRPSPTMRDAMAQAEVGDDVFSDDPTVNALEAYTAELTGLPGITCDPATVQSNMVFAIFEDAETAAGLPPYLAERGISVLGGQVMRLVTHLDVTREAVELLVNATGDYLCVANS